MMTTKERHEAFLEEIRKPLKSTFGNLINAGGAKTEGGRTDDPTEVSEEDPA